jgi:hypothetical protein
MIVLVLAVILGDYRGRIYERTADGTWQIVDYGTNATVISYTCWSDGELEIHKLDSEYAKALTVDKLLRLCNNVDIITLEEVEE